MPGDATHVKYAKFIVVIGAIIAAGLGWDPINIIATAALYMFCTMYLSPDLDLPGTAPLKRWGNLQLTWYLFEKKIKHRSPWSHGFILGFITIWANFLSIVAVVIAFLRLCWLPLIEPMIDQANATIDDILILNLSSGLQAVIIWVVAVGLVAHWQHWLMDKTMRN